MFTAIQLDPKSVAMFAAHETHNTTELRDYAIELVTDLQRAIDDVCHSGKINGLSDDHSVDFKFRSDDRVWEGSIWVTVYDDLPGCPTEINCSIAYYSEDPAECYDTSIGTMPDERYESFDLVAVSGYSRSEVYGIKRELQTKEIEAYVKGYASGQENGWVNANGKA